MKTIVCLIGPSGSGKTTIGNYLHSLYDIPEIITHTTRDMREGEQDGIQYHFVNRSTFLSSPMIESVEYDGNLYGTSAWEIQEKLQKNDACYAVVTYSGFEAYKEAMKDRKDIRVISVGIRVDPLDCISRMIYRGDDRGNILKRIENYKKTMEFKDVEKCMMQFDNTSSSDIKQRVYDFFTPLLNTNPKEEARS